VPAHETTLSGGRRERALALLAVAEADFRRTARRLSLCVDDAEDAFQPAVEILLTKAPDRPPAALVAWMEVVTRRQALAVRRARERILTAWRHDGNDLFDGLLCDRPGPVERAENRERVAALSRSYPFR
jgi:DNA-directed RNA polymerase specialized sigma24 family protein